MGAVILDSSVVLGLFDPQDAHHNAAATEVRRLRGAGTAFIVPASVLTEVLVGAARQDTTAVHNRRTAIDSAFGPVRVIDDEIAVAAAFLRAGHRSLRLPDALVIATGIVDDADVILTADKRWAGVDDRVRVIG